jgi:hypothetical protein
MAPKDLTKQYTESFSDLTDSEKQEIKKRILGIDTEVLAEKSEQQEAFRGLAADLLKTTLDKLKQQKAKEAEFDMIKGLPGFSEIANMGGNLSNSILGEIGGAAGMAGVDAGSLMGGGKDLESSLSNMAGLGFLQGAQYNWQKWFDGELSARYENMKKVQGIGAADKKFKLDKKFTDAFIKDYIKPRFDYSKSIDEFITYIDVKQDEENILQTETTLGKYKDLVKKKTEKFLQDLKGKKIGFNASFYADPLSKYELKEDGVNYKGLSASKAEAYQNQKDEFNQEWSKAKATPYKKHKELGNKSWNQLAVLYGYDIKKKNQFAKLHYNVLGHKKGFDGAKDLLTDEDIDNFIYEEIMPSVAETDIKLGNKPFMEFVSPESYADKLLGDYNVGTKEYMNVLKDLGIDAKDLDPKQARDAILSAIRTGGAEEIRAKIKYYNENKKKPSQKYLGVSYIERDEDYDKKAYDKDTSPLYQIFVKGGYQGTEDEFFKEFMPDADKGDMDLIGGALKGDGIGGMFGNIDTTDPFAALASIGGLMGDKKSTFGDSSIKSSSKDKGSSYFDIFGDKEKEYDDYTNKYSGIQNLGTFGSFNYFK